MNKIVILFRIFLLSIFPFILNLAGCDVPPIFPKDVAPLNIKDDFGINGTQMRLYLQCGTAIKSILPFEHFMEFGNYDIIGVDTGVIKAATIASGMIFLPQQNISSKPFLDDQKMGYDGGIYLCCTNFSGLSAYGLNLGVPDDTIEGYTAYNLNTGMPFTCADSLPGPVTASFKIYGIADSVVKDLVPVELKITFYGIQHTKASIAMFDSVSAADLQMSTTNDSLFTKLLMDIKAYDLYARSDTTNAGGDILSKKQFHIDSYKPKNGYDSTHIKTLADSIAACDTVIRSHIFCSDTTCDTTYDTTLYYRRFNDPFYGYSVGDTIYCGVNEKSAVHASAQNSKVFLTDRLISMIDTTYTFPGGVGVKTLPPIGPEFDNYLCLYSNISGLLDALNVLKNANTIVKADDSANVYLNLGRFLGKVVGGKGNSDLGSLDPSMFSKFILYYTDYLFYAGLCSYLDDDFFSRYINHHKLLVDEVMLLVDKVADEYYNNIVIRFYAVAAFYDFLLDRGEQNLVKLVDGLDDFVNSDGEYGEGIGYLNYVSEILLPIVYIGIQEQYLYGQNAGNKWISDTSEVLEMYKKIGEYCLNNAANWGELPAFDDGYPNIPYLAPYSVITGESKYLQFSKDVRRLCDNGMYDSLEHAERVHIHGPAPWKMFLYPYNRSFTGSGNWKHPLDSVRHTGSIVQIPSGTVNDNLNMTVIAEENPEDGGTHDKIDHGAIQFTRYINNTIGNAPHVDHLIISPGYPGFSDEKRHRIEWHYCNQNVQMLLDSTFSFTINEIQHEYPVDSEKPEEDADDEEFLGGDDTSVSFIAREKFNYKENGGMTGYRYMTPWEIREMVHKYVLRDKGLQNNVWGIVDAMAMSKIPQKTLSRQGGGGKSSVQNRYRNGVEIKIEYKYPKEQELFHYTDYFYTINCGFYYNRNIVYETSYHGIRGVYTLGNNYYVIDHLPQTSLPSTASLAASWNMPKNTTQMGTSGWQQFVFEGTTPINDSSLGLVPRSRIELAVAGANEVDFVCDSTSTFKIKQGDLDTIRTTHISFSNNLNNHKFLIAQFRVCNANNNLSGITSYQIDTTLFSGGIVWKVEYLDGTIDAIVYNPDKNTQIYEGITSDAEVLIMHSDINGVWQTARLFNSTQNPTFSGYSPTPIVTNYGVQYDIVF